MLAELIKPHRRIKAIKQRSVPGTEPGTLLKHSDLAQYNTEMQIIAYDERTVISQKITEPKEALAFIKKYAITWLQVTGLGNVETLQKITEVFKLNALAMEDVVNTHQRSKLEEYGDIFFTTARVPEFVDEQLTLQQLSMFWGKKFVLTFQEFRSNCFEHLIARIDHGGKREKLIRPQYLAYSILDTVVDDFFPVLEKYGASLDTLEENAIDNPSSWVIRHIHDLKHDLHALRRSIWSQRDAIGSFKIVVEKDKDLWFYIRDCEDHTIQLLDIIESYRDRSSGLMDIYLASVNNRTNKIVKQLTMIATFFMPIGVFAGIYGMNFDRSYPLNMPELRWPYGYLYFWSMVIVFAITILTWFAKKGWFKR